MGTLVKNERQILKKIGIERLNDMQQDAKVAIHSCENTLLLSPTGSGKTLAYLLPIVSELKQNEDYVQALIVVPSRELALQIEQVFRDMGSGFRAVAVYGGRMATKDRQELKHTPSVIIGTPGRLADHIRRRAINTSYITTLVLDEFDKSLEIGFEDDMIDIVSNLKAVQKKVLTSATKNIEIPDFVRWSEPAMVDYLDEKVDGLQVKGIISPTKDKLDTLSNAIKFFGNEPGIVFCNFKESIRRVSEHLESEGIAHGCFYGGMEQQDRERTLIKFRNRTHQLLLATDLAARGLDIPELKFIIHYHLPTKESEFVHRNGRTARMQSSGTAYVLTWEKEHLPSFIKLADTLDVSGGGEYLSAKWETLFISGGRKDKISKGDIAGVFLKQGGIQASELGAIELKHDCSFVSVKKNVVIQVVKKTDNLRIKKKKVRVKII